MSGPEPETALDPHELELWGRQRAYAVYCTWSAEAPCSFEAVFLPESGAQCYDGLYRPLGDAESRPLTNVPAASRQMSRLLSWLREELAAELPEYMVPSDVMVIERAPLTPHGKVDPAKLPELEVTGGEYDSPRTPLEAELAGLFAEVLGVERVGIEDDFFDCGGSFLPAGHPAHLADPRGAGVRGPGANRVPAPYRGRDRRAAVVRNGGRRV